MKLKKIRSSKERRVYLDYAASTPVAGAVLTAMISYFKDSFGNPGSIHYLGQESQAATDKAREIISCSIGAKFNEIIFTSSATEANNLALRGTAKEFRIQNIKYKKSLNPQSYILNPRIIVSSIEHESILDTARDLEEGGAEVIYLPVDRQGFIDLEKLKEALNERTVLVSVMYANNEIGTIQPIIEISKLISEFRKQKIENRSRDSKFHSPNSTLYPLFHTDAVQAFQFLNCMVYDLGVDLMTVSSHKIYGPKGAGALYVRDLEANEVWKPMSLKPIITGGGQEYGLRSGTENVPAIVGFGKAVELIERNKAKEEKRIKNLRDYFWVKLKNLRPEIELNGLPISSPERLPNNLSIYFPHLDSRELLIKLDLNGIAVSAGSACSARSIKPSHVIAALNLGEDRAKSSLRISFGGPTTKEELDIALKRIINLM